MRARLRDAILKESEAREALNANTDDGATEGLQEALTAASKEVREALADEPVDSVDNLDNDDPDAGEDAEARERRELRERADVGDFFRAAVVHGSSARVEGVAAECAAAYGCPGQIPIQMLDGPREVRADAVSAGPDADTQQVTAPILPAVFLESIAAEMDIDMPMVAAGQAVYPVLTKSVTAGTAAKDAGVDATAATITPTKVTPTRIVGGVLWRREDAALLGGLDSTLVSDLSSVLRDVLDVQVASGDGSGANMTGLGKQLALSAAGSDAAATTYSVLVQRAAEMVDGLYARSFNECRALMSVEAYRYLASLFRANETEATGLDWLMRMYGGVRATGRIAEAAKTGTDGKRSPVFVRRTRPVGRVAVAPVWQGVELIRDEITGARKGQVSVTAYMLIGGIAFLRSKAFGTFAIATGAK